MGTHETLPLAVDILEEHEHDNSSERLIVNRILH